MKTIEILPSSVSRRKLMKELEPLEVGRLCGKVAERLNLAGNIVMRTARIESPEVIDLCDGEPDGCWTNLEMTTLEVEQLDSPLRIELSHKWRD